MSNATSLAAARAIEGNDPFTPDRLLEIAVKWEDVMRDKQASDDAHPDVSFSFAYYRSRQAFGVADYMKRHGIAEKRNIGCFQLDSVKVGDMVKLPKGLELKTTHPSIKGPVKRDRTVKVHRVVEGYTNDLENPLKALVSNPKVEWVGSGGYWYWADIDDVILMPTEAQQGAVQ